MGGVQTGHVRIAAALWKHRYLYLLILPGIAFYLLFDYAPLYGVTLAFKKFMYNKGISGSPWVGLANFQYILKDSGFWNAFRNTIIISFGKLVIGFPAPIILALLLNELRREVVKRTFQSILYLPHFFSWVIVAGLVFNLLSSTSGAISRLIVQLGGEPLRVLGNPAAFRPLVYATAVWKGAGWGTIIYLAAIAGINPELYESAYIDGAGRWQRMRFITLPSLAYAVFILLILDIGYLMEAGFDQIFNLYNPPTYPVGDIIDTYVYRIGVVMARYDRSTAIGLFKSVINCALLLSTNRVVKALGYEGLF